MRAVDAEAEAAEGAVGPVVEGDRREDADPQTASEVQTEVEAGEEVSVTIFYPTIKSPKKDTRQMDLGTAPDGFFTRQMEILKKDRAMWESKIHPARCFQLARDLHWTGPKK